MSSQPKTHGDKPNEQTLVLIDGHALAYRAYFALASTGFQTRSGELTHAVYGFALMSKILRETAVEQIAVFDDLTEAWHWLALPEDRVPA